MANNYALNIFCRPSNCIASLIFFSWLYLPYPASSYSQKSLTFFWRDERSICVKVVLGTKFKGCFVLVVWDWWDCVMRVCVWDSVSEGISCFTFVNFIFCGLG